MYPDRKHFIIRHLANFAYDPINFDFFIKFGVLELFLDNLRSSSEFLKCSISGICNCSLGDLALQTIFLLKNNLDPRIQKTLFKNNGIELVSSCLSSSDHEVCMDAITTLYFILGDENVKGGGVVCNPILLSHSSVCRCCYTQCREFYARSCGIV
jgi:hypothetical protein